MSTRVLPTVARWSELLQSKAAGSAAGRTSTASALRDNLVRDHSVDIGQTEVAARIEVRELLVIEAEQVQHGRVQIVNVHTVLHCVVADLIGVAIGETALHTAA